jgi:hypothetical protein
MMATDEDERNDLPCRPSTDRGLRRLPEERSW